MVKISLIVIPVISLIFALTGELIVPGIGKTLMLYVIKRYFHLEMTRDLTLLMALVLNFGMCLGAWGLMEFGLHLGRFREKLVAKQSIRVPGPKDNE